MRKIVNRYPMLILFLAAMLVVSAADVFGAAVGQIKGSIKDKDSKEPVPGATVLIKGTKIGAMTDPDGNYVIARVEPGQYILVVSSVSYNTTEISGVSVTADLTSEQSILLTKKISELDVKITVTAKQDIINKFETSNQQTISAQEIKSRPVQTVDNLLKQVAGVQTTQSGQVFIRGGRAGEVSYIVDGVPIGDPLGGTGQAGANLSLVSGSIQEIQIIKDGFDPEYGDALSGIVKITSATGSKDNTKVHLQYQTDDLGSSKLNKYSWNYDYAQFSISGPDPILKNRLLPALGLKFLEDKEFTYYLYGEVTKDDGVNQYERFNTPVTPRIHDNFSLFGVKVPERLNNSYYWTTTFQFRPTQNLKAILSYKNSQRDFTDFNWDYRYSARTAPIGKDKWQSVSLELSQAINKNFSYEAVFSYYDKRVSQKPGDPDRPGVGLNPDQFASYDQWEFFTDNNGNGVYDPPEPLINLYPDSATFGLNFSGPAYTFGEDNVEVNSQAGTTRQSNFRFNRNGLVDNLEGEPFIDLNGNGVWDRGDFLADQNGNGRLDENRISRINNHTSEPYVDGDSNLGEPFTDVNRNGVFDQGIDVFVMSANAGINQDLNHDGTYNGPSSLWEIGIPYIDRNGNGIFDRGNGNYDPGEPFSDVNGNGIRDDRGRTDFLDPISYDETARWLDYSTKTLRGEVKVFRLMGAHELKGGAAIAHDFYDYREIRRPYMIYSGRPDGGDYPTRGQFRDFFEYSPWSGAIYLRDKLEYGSMIASLGLRWDFYLQDTKRLYDVAVNDQLSTGIIYGDRQRLSPRIGFSYPISDKAKVHFNYGHFFQLPDRLKMYARNTTNVDANSVVGNYNLDYMKTIQYSFGVKYAMTENYSVDFSGYFKDEFDKINAKEVRPDPLSSLTVQQYRNVDYGRSRGLELQIDKRGGGYVTGQLSYTYAFAYGKASEATTSYQSPLELAKEPLSESPLDNDIRHSLKVGVQVYIPNTVKPRLFGLPISNGWSLSLESIIESGKPFTPTSSYPNITHDRNEAIEKNSLRYPGTAVFDVRFQKEFRLVGMNYSFILWVRNLFNARNVTSVYDKTGRPDTQQNNGGIVRGGAEYDRNPENWNYGRQIRLGLEVNL